MSKLQLKAKSDPQPIFVNKVLLGHSMPICFRIVFSKAVAEQKTAGWMEQL